MAARRNNPASHPKTAEQPRRGRAAATPPPAPASPVTFDVESIAYKTWFERTPDSVLLVNGEGRIIDANPAACRVTGYRRDELQALRADYLLREPSAKRRDSGRKAGGGSRELEPPLAIGSGPQGGPYPVLRLKEGALRTVEAQVIDFDGGVHQITVRLVGQAAPAVGTIGSGALEGADALHVRATPPAIIMVRADGRIVSWSAIAADLLGYTAEEAIGMPLTRLVPPHLIERHASGFRQATEGIKGGPYERTLCVEATRKDGSTVPLDISLGSVTDGDETLFTAVVLDMAEHRRIVERLNDALQRLQFHVERMPLAYIVWDANFHVEEWNRAAERIFGYTKEEALGHHAYDLIVPPEVQPMVEVVWQKLLHGDASSHSINDNMRSDGTRVTCEWFNTPLRDPGGAIRGVASMAMDISEREVLQTQIRNTQRLDSLAVMASGVAHDFNSALMIILGNAALLRRTKGLPPSAFENIELVEEAGLRANELIKRLLAYARTGRHRPQPTVLNKVIEQAKGFLKAAIARHHTIRFRLAPRLPTVFADHSQLEQILLNLCLNASQATPKAGEIEISTRRTELSPRDVARCVPHDGDPGPYVELCVRDTGCGIEKTTLERIFDPFFTTKPEGHGLGLAAVLGILRQHNGMAAVTSEVGQGTTVRVFLPVFEAPAVETPDKGPPRRRASSRGTRRRTARK